MAVQLTILACKKLTNLSVVSSNHSLSITDFTETLGTEHYIYTLNEGVLDLQEPEHFLCGSTEFITQHVLLDVDSDVEIELVQRPIYITNYFNEQIASNCFTNNTVIESVDCNNVPWVNNSMYGAFDNCTNLKRVTNTSSAVTNIANAFNDCPNLQEVTLNSTEITEASGAFTCHSQILVPQRNVYCHFRNLETKQLTSTALALIDAGYDSLGTLSNVYLKNIDAVQNRAYVTVYTGDVSDVIQFYEVSTKYAWENENHEVVYTIVEEPIVETSVYDANGDFIGQVDAVNNNTITYNGDIYTYNETLNINTDTALSPIATDSRTIFLDNLPKKIKYVVLDSNYTVLKQNTLKITSDTIIDGSTFNPASIDEVYITGYINQGTDSYIYKTLNNNYYELINGQYNKIPNEDIKPTPKLWLDYVNYNYSRGSSIFATTHYYYDNYQATIYTTTNPNAGDYKYSDTGNYYIYLKNLPETEKTYLSTITNRRTVDLSNNQINLTSYTADFVYDTHYYYWSSGRSYSGHEYLIYRGVLIRDLSFKGFRFNNKLYQKYNTNIPQSIYTYKAWVNPDNEYDIVYTTNEADYYLYNIDTNAVVYRNEITTFKQSSYANFTNDGNILYLRYFNGSGIYSSQYENKNYSSVEEASDRMYKYVRDRSKDINTLPYQVTLKFQKIGSYIIKKCSILPGNTLYSALDQPEFRKYRVGEFLGQITKIHSYVNQDKTITYNPVSFIPTSSLDIYAIIGVTTSSSTMVINMASWTSGDTPYVGYYEGHGSIVSGDLFGVGSVQSWYKYTSSGTTYSYANITNDIFNEYGYWSLNIRYDNDSSTYYTDDELDSTSLNGVYPSVPLSSTGNHRFDFWLTPYGDYSIIL